MPPDPPTKQNPATRQRRSTKKDPEDIKAETSTYAREIELKRSRGEISCAECRRLKIRCDKTIPCQSCQRRGCAALCPNGSLATGQGTRFVLAATEHLHRRIAKMSERVRELEDALAIAHAKCSDEPHPLLTDGDSGGTKQAADYPMTDQPPTAPRSIIDSFGMISLSDRGASSTFFGPTGGSEYLLVSEGDGPKSSASWGDSDATDSPRNSRSPADNLLRVSDAFPFIPVGSTSDVHESLLDRLPSYEKARHLAETYIEHAAWLFRGVTTDQILDEMLPFIYAQPLSVEDASTVDYSGPHDLALLYLILAIGCLVDFNQELHNKDAELYEKCARAAMCLQPVWINPSLSTVQALHLLSIYYGMTEDESRPDNISMELSWGQLSLAAQVSQILGLHRDSSQWGLPDKLVYRRRLLFWNIFEADAWQALGTGRPPCLSRSFVDCQAAQADELLKEEDADVMFEEFFMRFAYECVSQVAAKTLSAEPPTYHMIMELDRCVRDFPVPPEALALLEDLTPAPDSEPLTVVTSMENFVMSHSREVLLLYIHRTFFAQAIIDCPTNPVKSEYAHSFLTAYRAAVVVLRTVKEQFAVYPSLCARIWPIWSYGFSAAVVFAAVVTRGPTSPLAQQAMSYLEMASELFSQATQHSRRAAKVNTVVSQLREKALASLAGARGGTGGSTHEHQKHEHRDELEIFAGRRTVTASDHTKRNSLSPTRGGSGPTQMGPITSPVASDSHASHASFLPPPQTHSHLPSYPVPGPSSMGDWTPQHHPMPMPYPPTAQWYRTSDYPQQEPGSAWANPHHPPPVQQQDPRSMMPAYQDPPPVGSDAQNIRHMRQAYAGPPGYHDVQAPYEPPQDLVHLGLTTRESNLDARWTSFVHESGFLDGVNFRT